MATPARKRLRLNDALHRPFRSPLKDSQSTLHVDNHDHNHAHVTADPGKPSQSAVTHGKEVADTKTHAFATSEKASSTASITSNATLPQSAASNRELEAQIRTIRSEIDVLTQANRLLCSDRRDELTTLISTWKSTARAAAEELFAGVKDKVNQMGGVEAWRDREKQQEERRRDWDREAREEELKKEEASLEEVEDEEVDEGDTAEEADAKRAVKDKVWEARQARREMLEQMKSEAREVDVDKADAEGEGAGGSVMMDDVSMEQSKRTHVLLIN